METHKYLVFLICWLVFIWSNRSWAVQQSRGLVGTVRQHQEGRGSPGMGCTVTCSELDMVRGWEESWAGSAQPRPLQPGWELHGRCKRQRRPNPAETRSWCCQRAPQAGQNSAVFFQSCSNPGWHVKYWLYLSWVQPTAELCCSPAGVKEEDQPCSCQSSQQQRMRRRNPTPFIITHEPALESRHTQVLIYSEPWQAGCSTLPSDVTNKAQGQQIEAIHYSWWFPPKPLPFLMTWRAGAEPQAWMGASEESRNPALRKVNSSHFLHKKFTACCHTMLLLAFITPWGLIDSFLAAVKQGCILQGNCSTAGAVGSCSIISRTLKAESKLNTQIITNIFPQALINPQADPQLTAVSGFGREVGSAGVCLFYHCHTAWDPAEHSQSPRAAFLAKPYWKWKTKKLNPLHTHSKEFAPLFCIWCLLHLELPFCLTTAGDPQFSIHI